jgi:hypothetical protein
VICERTAVISECCMLTATAAMSAAAYAYVALEAVLVAAVESLHGSRFAHSC